MVLTTLDTRNQFLSFFGSKNYQTIERHNFTTPPNSKATFPFCCGMFYEEFYNDSLPSLSTRLAISQFCIRNDNFYRVGCSPKHLTFFEMLGLFDFCNTTLSNYEDTFAFLKNIICEERLIVNVPDDKEGDFDSIRELIKDYGFSIRTLPLKNLLWNANIETKKKGFRIEVNYVSPKGLEIELWNISRIDNGDGTYIYDSGVCAERLNIAQNSLENIFTCSELVQEKSMITTLATRNRKQEYFLKCVLNKSGEESFFINEEELNLIADLSRLSKALLNAQIFPTGRGDKRGMHLRAFMKKILTYAYINNLDLTRLQDCFVEDQKETINKEVKLFNEQLKLEHLDATFKVSRELLNKENLTYKLTKGYQNRSQGILTTTLSGQRHKKIRQTTIEELSKFHDIAPLEILIDWCLQNKIPLEKPLNDFNDKKQLMDFCNRFNLNQTILERLQWI